MANKKTTRETVLIRLDSDVVKLIEKDAQRLDRSRNWLVSRIAEKYVADCMKYSQEIIDAMYNLRP